MAIGGAYQFYLPVIDERRLTVYHEFIVLQERDGSANIPQLDCNRALSYRDLIVMEHYHIGTSSCQRTIILPLDGNRALLHLKWSLLDSIGEQ